MSRKQHIELIDKKTAGSSAIMTALVTLLHASYDLDLPVPMADTWRELVGNAKREYDRLAAEENSRKSQPTVITRSARKSQPIYRNGNLRP